MDSPSSFRMGTASHLDHTFSFTGRYLFYFGNVFEQPFWNKNLFCCYTNKDGNSDTIAPQKFVVEKVVEVTDRHQIVVGV